MISGPYRIPIVEFMNAQAVESLQHAQQAGEIITGLDGHPDQGIAHIEETHQHDALPFLENHWRTKNGLEPLQGTLGRSGRCQCLS